MSDEKEIKTFEEFWDFYVGEHRDKTNRILHFVGTTAAVTCFATGLLTKRKWLMLAVPVLGYGPAWVGHFLFEKNKPASFKYPLWSLRADFVMWSKIVRGQMQAEVDRVLAAEREKQETADKSTNGEASVSEAVN